MRGFSVSSTELTGVHIVTEPVVSEGDGLADVHHRSSLVPGYDHAVMRKLRACQVGCGGLGGPIARALARKGIASLSLLDADSVEISNLNRQLFGREDLFQSKAPALARVAAREATDRTVIRAWPLTFQAAVARDLDFAADVFIVGVDNDETRVDVATHCLQQKVPGMFLGVSRDAGFGYVMSQTSRPGDACWGCVFPDAVKRKGRMPCDAGATLDILLVLAGLATFALDALVMKRPCGWNYREVCLSGAIPDLQQEVERRADCPICGDRASPAAKARS